MFLFFVPVFLYAVTMLIFQIKRIISSEKWFNYVVFVLLKILKIWVGWTTLNGEKKEDGLTEFMIALPAILGNYERRSLRSLFLQ